MKEEAVKEQKVIREQIAALRELSGQQTAAAKSGSYGAAMLSMHAGRLAQVAEALAGLLPPDEQRPAQQPSAQQTDQPRGPRS